MLRVNINKADIIKSVPILILIGCWAADITNQTFDYSNNLTQLLYVLLYYAFCETRISQAWIQRAAVCVAIFLIVGFYYSIVTQDYTSDIFDSKVSYAIHLAVLFPLIIGRLGLNFRKKGLLKTVARVCIIVSALSVLVVAESRVAIVAVVLVLLIRSCPKWAKWKHRNLIICVAAAGLLSSIYFLYKWKEDSVLGRLTIYKVLVRGISESPLLGTGSWGFHRTYMLQQSKYFEENHNDSTAILADSIVYPYNEGLGFAYKYGVPTAVLAVAFLLLIIGRHISSRYVDLNRQYLWSLLIFCFIGLFSFPTHYCTMNVWGLWVLAQLSSDEKSKPCFRKIIYGLIVVVGSWVLAIQTSNAKDKKAWEDAQELLFNSKSGLNEYEELLPKLHDNPLFLYNYAAELNFVRNFSKSTEILSLCQQKLNNYDTELLAADNAISLRQDSVALQHLKCAHFMVPARFYPLSGMLTVYMNKGDTLHADSVAEIILRKEVKIPSADINFIKKRATNWLKKQ